MANSGSKYGSVSQRNSVYRTHLYWYIKSSNVMTNITKINVALYIDRVDTHYEFEDNVEGIVITVNGISYHKSNFYLYAYDSNWSNGSIKIFDTDVDIVHDSLGQSSFAVAAACAIAGNWGPGSCNISDTNFTLDTLDRNPPSVTNLRASSIDKTSMIYTVDVYKVTGTDWSHYRLNGGDWINTPSDKTITGLNSNTDYTLQVRYRATVNGTYGESNILSFKTLPNDLTPPEFISANVKPIDNHTIYAMSIWTAPVDGIKEILVSIDNGVTYNKSQGNISGLTANTPYDVKFKAVGNNNVVTYSNSIAVTTKEDPINTQEISGSWKQGIMTVKTNGVIDV